MKKKLMVTVVLTAALIGGGTGAVLAACGRRGGFGVLATGMELEEGNFEGHLAKVLTLTNAQHKQIKTLLVAQ